MAESNGKAWGAVAGAAALSACALAVALPFRARVLARALPLHYSWDSALHVLSGLDLADDARRLALGSALARLLGAHWWGPLFALATAPLQAIAGAAVSSATLVSLLSFALAPALAWLLARGATGSSGLLAAPLVLVLFLRSPFLLEASAWPMLESLGGLLSLLAWLLFARGARRRACALAAALFFLKYHYGVFLGATLLAATVSELPREERRAFAARGAGILRRPLAAGFLAVVALLAAARLATEKGGAPRFLPSVSNIAWGSLVIALLAAAARRRAAGALWRDLPEPVRDVLLFAAAAPALWLLDPANVRAFWRQIHQDWVANPPGPLENARSLASFFRDDFVASPWMLPLLALGLALALWPARPRALRFAALFTLWPPIAMCFSAFPLEPRFVGCLLPTMYAAAAAGLVAGAAALPRPARAAASGALVLAAAAQLAATQRSWAATVAPRVRFAYPNSPDEDRFVAALADALPADRALVVALPPGLKLGPTIRLSLRLSRRALSPAEIVAEDERPASLLDDLPHATRSVTLASADDEATIVEAARRSGFAMQARRAGPPLPDGSPVRLFDLAR